MSQNYVFPGNANTYVPTLELGLVVEFTRKNFPIDRYITKKPVSKESGLYLQFKNDNQVRFQNAQQFAWADGNDASTVLGTGKDSYTFQPYTTKRYLYPEQIGYLAVEQASWDLLGEMTRKRAMQGMTARSFRIAQTLTTSANYPTANYSATATALAGGPWSSATSTTPYIKESVLQMTNVILQQTLGVVQPNDLYLVMNPNTAIIVAGSSEIIDFLKQSPVAMDVVNGKAFNSRFGLPDSLYGVNLVVDDAVYNNAAVGAATQSLNFTVPNNTVFICSKQNAITPSIGSSFSTFELLQYGGDWQVSVYNDTLNKKYNLQIVENTCEILVAPMSGYLIGNVSS